MVKNILVTIGAITVASKIFDFHQKHNYAKRKAKELEEKLAQLQAQHEKKESS